MGQQPEPLRSMSSYLWATFPPASAQVTVLALCPSRAVPWLLPLSSGPIYLLLSNLTGFPVPCSSIFPLLLQDRGKSH